MKRAGKHYYQFYKGREDFFRIVVPFLLRGLEENEACLWIVSRSVGVLEAVEAFRKTYDPTPHLETKQLVILPAERWYFEGGRFSARKVLAKLKKFAEDKERQGFKGFRGVGDLGWLDFKSEDWTQLQSYEEKAHSWIRELCMTVVCAYPLRYCSMAQTKEILDRHDDHVSASHLFA